LLLITKKNYFNVQKNIFYIKIIFSDWVTGTPVNFGGMTVAFSFGISENTLFSNAIDSVAFGRWTLYSSKRYYAAYCTVVIK
jgi:hypothetical protein